VEVDEILLQNPLVSEAVCFGVPDKIYGEEVHAAVVLKQHETNESRRNKRRAEITEYCRTHLVAFKAPKVIYLTEAIPRTATGKIQRKTVAAHFTKLAEAERMKTKVEESISVRTFTSKL